MTVLGAADFTVSIGGGRGTGTESRSGNRKERRELRGDRIYFGGWADGPNGGIPTCLTPRWSQSCVASPTRSWLSSLTTSSAMIGGARR